MIPKTRSEPKTSATSFANKARGPNGADQPYEITKRVSSNLPALSWLSLRSKCRRQGGPSRSAYLDRYDRPRSPGPFSSNPPAVASWLFFLVRADRMSRMALRSHLQRVRRPLLSSARSFGRSAPPNTPTLQRSNTPLLHHSTPPRLSSTLPRLASSNDRETLARLGRQRAERGSLRRVSSFHFSASS